MVEVRVPLRWQRRAAELARRRVYNYRVGLSESSRAYAHRNADKNLKLQTESIIAECAFALRNGLDPERAVNWTDKPLAFDVDLGGLTVDVKSTHLNGTLLIWSVAKNSIFHSKAFDALCLVKVGEDGFCVIPFNSWISKGAFLRDRKIAGANNKWRLDVGTWYLHENDLWPTSVLERK
jgi:hypothetical protein